MTTPKLIDIFYIMAKLVMLILLGLIYSKIVEIRDMKKKEGYTFNTQKARPQQRQPTRERFSINPAMDDCIATCKSNDWSPEGTDISPDGQCELQCSHYANYSADSPCFKDMSNYPTL
jgi:hypothetical protein